MIKSAVERRKELEHQFPIWERKTLGTHFADQTEKYPERSFLITAEKEWTYQDVWEESIRTAKAMMALGVRKRDHIAL